MGSDPKPAARARDPELLRALHVEWRECALADLDLPACLGASPRSLHHVHRHPRDDVRANLVMLCGSGTTGCHGAIEHADEETRRALGRHIRIHRPDTFGYLREKLGGPIQADEWLRRYLA